MKKLLSFLLFLIAAFGLSPTAIAAVDASVMTDDEYERYVVELYGEPLGYTLPDEVAEICSGFEWIVLRDTNRERLAAGAAPLTVFASIQRAADTRSKELLISYSHFRPDGSIPTTVFKESGMSIVDIMTGSELCAASFPSAAVQAWMNSNKHRNALLSKAYVHSGVGVHKNPMERKYYEIQLLLPEREKQSDLSFLLPPSMVFPTGTSIDTMGIVIKIRCPIHGDCYTPLLKEMCTGYDPAKNGRQTVTAKYEYAFQGGAKESLTGAFTVYIADK